MKELNAFREKGKDFLNPYLRGIIIVLIILTLIGSDLSKIYGAFTYFKYSIVFIFVIFLFNKKSYFKKEVLVFLYILVISILKIWQVNTRTLMELTFILIPILPFFVVDFNKINVKKINVGLIFLFFIIYASEINIKLDLLSFLKSETSATETNISSFIFSMLFTYFMINKNKKWMIINFVMVIIAFKRIAFISIIFVYIFYILNIYKIFKSTIFYIILNLLVVIMFSYLAIGVFDDVIYNYTGLSIGHFTQGRTKILQLVIDRVNDDFFTAFTLGLGQGRTIEIIINGLGHFELLHNDIFKLFWEYGFFIFILLIHLIYKNNNKILTLQLNVFMLTDNVLIYAPVIFAYLFLSTKLNNIK